MFNIATLDDVRDYLGAVLNGSISASVLVNIRDKVNSYYEEVFVTASEKEKLKAGELLYKIFDCPTKVKKGNVNVIVDDMSENFSPVQMDYETENCDNHDERFAPVLQYLTRVMEGTSTATFVVNVKGEQGYFSEEIVKSPSHEERIKAAELLYKYYLTSTVDLSELTLPLIVGGD